MRLKTTKLVLLTSLLAGLSLMGCDRFPGEPGPGPEVVRPEQILDATVLYKTNCAACHGASGKGGAAIALNNPIYLSVIGEEAMRDVTSKGVKGKLMPHFAKSAGGSLTDQQVSVLVHGIFQQWDKPGSLSATGKPTYRAALTADAANGQQAYGNFCASCHGDQGQGTTYKANGKTVTTGSIVNESYLALISDQGLRGFIVAGVPDGVMPDYRSDASTPMSDQQITDVVAWLAAKRTVNPGQPYATHP